MSTAYDHIVSFFELRLHEISWQAIDFAKEQNDDDLWEDLLKYSETRPSMSFVLCRLSPLTWVNNNSVHPRAARERRSRNQPLAAHPPHQERARDPRSSRGPR